MNGGRKIIDGLKDAVAGNFARVTIDGQVWVRKDSYDWLVKALEPIVASYLRDEEPIGDSDLYDEQPRSVHVTLGDLRRARAALSAARPDVPPETNR